MAKTIAKKSKKFNNYGMLFLIIAIVLVLALTIYIIVDGTLHRSNLITDQALLNSVSDILQQKKPNEGKQYPANITQKDLDEVKVLSLISDLQYVEGAGASENGYYSLGYTLAFGYDDALALLKKQEAEAEATENNPNDNENDTQDTASPTDLDGEETEPTVSDLMTSSFSTDVIKDFSCLANFKNVEYIMITGTDFSTLSFYQYYYQITIVGEDCMKNLKDISFISDITSLTSANISMIAATDFTPVSSLSALKTLNVQYCDMQKTTGFENLTNLEYLNLSGTYSNANIGTETDISKETGLSDISFISSLKNIKGINLGNNLIKNIGVIQNLSNLKTLTLESNKIADISALKNLPALETLNLASNQISDVSVLSGLTSLKYLNLGKNEITDISAISGLALLEELALNENELTSIKGLENCLSLTKLDLSTTEEEDHTGHNHEVEDHDEPAKISDITLLSNLTKLKYLYLNNHAVFDITPLADLTALETLHIDNNIITDVNALGNLVFLTDLSLSNNFITDVTPLAILHNLKTLNLAGNRIEDFSPLNDLEEVSETTITKDNQIIDNADTEGGDEPAE